MDWFDPGREEVDLGSEWEDKGINEVGLDSAMDGGSSIKEVTRFNEVTHCEGSVLSSEWLNSSFFRMVESIVVSYIKSNALYWV